jgi:hypothetical protein
MIGWFMRRWNALAIGARNFGSGRSAALTVRWSSSIANRTGCSTPDQSSEPGRLRSALVRARAFFSSARRRRAARLGFVARRFGGSGFRTSRIRSASRWRAIWRFRHWDRVSSTMTMTVPSVANRARTRSRVSSSKARDSPTSNRNSTRVDDRLACCPPGPPVVEKVQRSSPAGIVIVSEIFRSSTIQPYREWRRELFPVQA